MKRWITNLGIAAYLGALALGVFAHAFNVGTSAHPAMYLVVWDMFCGWSSYEGRVQIIGEGESGKFYELAPGPWGDFHPYGNIGRQQYDTYGTFAIRLAQNCLKHTAHEPMTRIFVIDEEYPKKFNMPDQQFEAYYGKPKEPHSYYHTRFVQTPDGMVLNSQPTWLTYQYQIGLRDNPRLVNDSRRSKPFIAFGDQSQSVGAYAPGPFFDAGAAGPVNASSPLAE